MYSFSPTSVQLGSLLTCPSFHWCVCLITWTSHSTFKLFDVVAIIITFPSFKAVIFPSLSTDAILLSDDSYDTFLLLTLSGFITGFNCSVFPISKIIFVLSKVIDSALTSFTSTSNVVSHPLYITLILFVPKPLISDNFT